MTPFLRVEEKGLGRGRLVELGDEDRAAYGKSVIVFLVGRSRCLKVVPGVEVVIAEKLEQIPVKMFGARLGLREHRTRSVAAVLRSIIGGKHLSLGNGIDVGINVERSIAAVIHQA